ncbi:MAG: TadE/TadG family type IV pilus assembly protein [Desulfobacca sp.]|uniref:TadE/TadG family type IV pilus assembly protein n=1 Tax=Desulfobacca sp. TaxID=2067990 RepID=UPI00404B904F
MRRKKTVDWQWRQFQRRQEGAVAVEFALVITILLFILGGVIDFGHYLYLRHVATNASREGARFGVVYSTSWPSESCWPSDSDIIAYVTSKYNDSLRSCNGSGPTVTIRRSGNTSGSDLTVEVETTKEWFILNTFIRKLPSADALLKPKGVTVMKLE